jgi:hypothetical protein
MNASDSTLNTKDAAEPMKHIIPFSFVSFVLVPLVYAGGFHDDFSNPSLESRQALRGEWTFMDGAARCKADPKLYKKFNNHGPILRWSSEFTDGTLEFEFQPKNCQRVIITLNEKGHVFRMLFHDARRTRFFGWIGQSSKTNKPKIIVEEGVPTINDLNGKWVKSKIVFHGNTANITYGDYKVTLKHEAIGRKKGEFTISFASGELAVRNVRLTAAD